VKGDLLEADNAYDCAICNKKVDALKRVCVKTLPHALIVHLKRFDFDYETMQRLKVKVGTASFKQVD
jgi:ubiquitin C-terminal hydrolase